MELYFKFRFYIEIVGFILLAIEIVGSGLIVICHKISEFLTKRFGKKDRK